MTAREEKWGAAAPGDGSGVSERWCRRTLRRLESQWRCGAGRGGASPPPADPAAEAETEEIETAVVLVAGAPCSGKTSVVQRLLGRSFPGGRVAPGPSAGGWRIVMCPAAAQVEEEGIILGDGLVSAAACLPLPLDDAASLFGLGFVGELEGSVCNASMLQKVTFVEAPPPFAARRTESNSATVSGEAETIPLTDYTGTSSGGAGVGAGADEPSALGTSYEFSDAFMWFAERSDLVLLVLDSAKCCLSSENISLLRWLQPVASKVRLILNKSDLLNRDELLLSAGSFMWSAGRALEGGGGGTATLIPEIIVTGSDSIAFAGDGGHEEEGKGETFHRLVRELHDLPLRVRIAKIKSLRRRAHRLRVHAYVADHLRGQLPYTFFNPWDRIWGRAAHERQEELLSELDDKAVLDVCLLRGLGRAEAPPAETIRCSLRPFDLRVQLPRLDKRAREEIDALVDDVTRLAASCGTRRSSSFGSISSQEPPARAVGEGGAGCRGSTGDGRDEGGNSTRKGNDDADDSAQPPLLGSWEGRKGLLGPLIRNSLHFLLICVAMVVWLGGGGGGEIASEDSSSAIFGFLSPHDNAGGDLLPAQPSAVGEQRTPAPLDLHPAATSPAMEELGVSQTEEDSLLDEKPILEGVVEEETSKSSVASPDF